VLHIKLNYNAVSIKKGGKLCELRTLEYNACWFIDYFPPKVNNCRSGSHETGVTSDNICLTIEIVLPTSMLL